MKPQGEERWWIVVLTRQKTDPNNVSADLLSAANYGDHSILHDKSSLQEHTAKNIGQQLLEYAMQFSL